jgi:pyruvate dehydrogenase E2 component (dihydrolipoyllysine-residue acetyltransferase)
MAHNIVMPALEMAQETGKLLVWRKKEGEAVAKGEPLLDIETDKAVVEIESPADGVLAGVKAREGDVIPVGQTIAWIVMPGEKPPAETQLSATGRRMDAKPAASPATAKTSEPAAATAASSARISPKARRLAREHNIDLSRVRGTGSDGEILAEDVLALVGSPGPAKDAPAAGALETMSSTARLMAERTTQSWTSVPHFFVVREVDAGAMLEAREKLGSAIEKAEGVRVTQTDVLVALAARVLVKHPRVNASWTGGGIRLNQEVNIGIAMAVNDGVVAAVIPGAQTKKLGEIAALRHDLTERARAGRLRPSDIAGATFTISNLGMYKVDAFSAIINPPQAAILAVGRITDRVVPVDGKPGIRPMLTMTLSSDHRVVDGARAASFLNDLAEAIREPEKWLA